MVLAGSHVFIRAVQQVNGCKDRLFMRAFSAVSLARELAAAGQKRRRARAKDREA
jgi:hypothetical protein